MPEFGTSGLRGLADDLTDDLCAAYARAFAEIFPNDGRLFLGQDLRDSSARIAAAVARGAASGGLSIVDCGVVPTPALALASLGARTTAIMVTGSHIPGDRNGLKFYRAEGEITKADEIALRQAVGAAEPSTGVRPLVTQGQAASAYVARYVSAFGADALAGMKIGFWSHSSAARDVLPAILTDLGAEVTDLGRTDHFVAVDTEAIGGDTRDLLGRWCGAHGLDAIVSTDGDGDRPLLADATGAVVPGDILGPLTARFLGAETIVTTVSANTLVERMEAFDDVRRTRIGSPYVIAGMEEVTGTKVLGYEPNGGVLLGFTAQGPAGPLAPLWTRDSALPILAVLADARATEVSIADLAGALPPRRTATDRLQNIPRERSLAQVALLLSGETDLLPQGLGAITHVDETDGARLTFESGAIVTLRPSGNAPELRCYVEADDDTTARALLAETLLNLRARVSG